MQSLHHFNMTDVIHFAVKTSEEVACQGRLHAKIGPGIKLYALNLPANARAKADRDGRICNQHLTLLQIFLNSTKYRSQIIHSITTHPFAFKS